jgi:hypothetical protein
MWIRCPNGVPTIVHDEAHITRLLNEGGELIPDPTEPEVVPLQTETVAVEDVPPISTNAPEVTTKKQGRQRNR